MILHFPILGVDLWWPGLIFLGFLSGTIGALFGVGGGVITTPFLNIVGVPMPIAVGTSATVIAGSAASSTVRNRKLKNVEWRTGAWLAVFMLPSVELSSFIMRHMQSSHPGVLDPWLRVAFIIAILVTTAVWWFKNENSSNDGGIWGRIRLPPFISLHDSRRISIWVIALSGVLAGFFAGFLGLGGGRIIMPVLLGVVCLGVKRSVGTSSFVILLSALYSAATFGIKGLTDYRAAGLLLVGSLVGAWCGSGAMMVVPANLIRRLYLLLSLAALLSMTIKQFGQDLAALVLLLGTCIFIAATAYVRTWQTKLKI